MLEFQACLMVGLSLSWFYDCLENRKVFSFHVNTVGRLQHSLYCFFHLAKLSGKSTSSARCLEASPCTISRASEYHPNIN